ncbi:MAG: caspase family protein [Chitinophagales bacterium]
MFKPLHFLLVVLLFACLHSSAGIEVQQGPDIKFSANAHLYIVTCGVDDYGPLFDIKFNSSKNDVTMLRDSISAQFCRFSGGNCAERIHSYILLDKEATNEKITETLRKITPLMKSDDILFFSFSGHMLDYAVDEDSILDYPYLVTYSEDVSATKSRTKFASTFLGLRELRSYLELMPCQNQMLVLDAGVDQTDVGWKFSTIMLKDIPEEQRLIQRNRILIAPEGSSIEVSKHGITCGQLSYIVSHFPYTLGLFNESDLVIGDLTEFANEEAGSEDYCNIVFESEVLNYLRRFCTCTPGSSRGASGNNDNADQPVFNRPLKKDLAVIVATDIYTGKPTWSNLSTPMKDAEAIETLLRTKYNFETRIIRNYTKDSLMNELKKLVRDSVTEQQQLLLFFAGHGHYSDDILDGALVMKDSKSLTDDPNMQSYFQFSYLSTFINRLPYKHIFVMLDVCFGGSFGNNNAKVVLRPESVPSDISIAELRKRKQNNKGRLYLASGESSVPDGLGHSPFAQKIIDKLNTSSTAITPQDLYQYCEKNITEPVFRKLADHDDNSEFYLLPAKN